MTTPDSVTAIKPINDRTQENLLITSATKRKLEASLGVIRSKEELKTFNFIFDTSIYFILNCDFCHWSHSVFSSTNIPREKGIKGKGSCAFDLNVRSVMAFREIGVDQVGIETLHCIINMPPPMNTNAYSKTISKLNGIFGNVAAETMKQDAEEAAGE